MAQLVKSASVPGWPDHRVLLEDLEWSGGTIKAGRMYNGATFPWWARLFLGGHHRPWFERACLIHDEMYSLYLHRRWADEEFKKCLDEDIGKETLTARLMFWGVRIGGWYGYYDPTVVRWYNFETGGVDIEARTYMGGA